MEQDGCNQHVGASPQSPRGTGLGHGRECDNHALLFRSCVQSRGSV